MLSYLYIASSSASNILIYSVHIYRYGESVLRDYGECYTKRVIIICVRVFHVYGDENCHFVDIGRRPATPIVFIAKCEFERNKKDVYIVSECTLQA